VGVSWVSVIICPLLFVVAELVLSVYFADAKVKNIVFHLWVMYWQSNDIPETEEAVAIPGQAEAPEGIFVVPTVQLLAVVFTP